LLSGKGENVDYVERIKKELKERVEPGKAEILSRFFQAFPGGYGEGDEFIGVRVPEQRKVAKKYYRDIPLAEAEMLLQEKIHEYRLTALFILCYRFAKTCTEEEREKIVNLYLNNLDYVNNWDLVDASAEKILGPFLLEREKKLLFRLADSGHLWRQRVAIISTFYFIKHCRYKETLELAKKYLTHEHDLIHKATGWMLREIGKRDFQTLYSFLVEHSRQMPRTMLRYAIEKLDPELRRKFMKK
jgi:3-methyladenine DNA glycosylase AlkD